MAVKYSALDQADQTTHSDGPSQLSPTPQATSAAMASPTPSTSPLPFLALAEQTFTPLSMDGSDSYLSDAVGTRGGDRKPNKSPGVLEAERLVRTAKSMEHLRRHASAASSKSTAAPATPAAGRGATIVSTMVQSFESLQASTAEQGLGYELLSRSKSHSERPAGLVSPPSTLSPSPSFSRSPSPIPAGPSPNRDASSAADAGLGAADEKKSVAAQDENTPVPQGAAATSDPHPSAPTPNTSQAHDPPDLPPDSSPPTIVANTTVVRPTPSTPSSSRPQTRSRAISNPTRSSIVRTSSAASLAISHPIPDVDKRSQAGGYLGNIAALEATAERLSMTSSIEEAIREEHNELKRTESRRSSILRANRARAASASDSGSVFGQPQHSVTSRQNSILGINTAARYGGYSPGGYVMSPHHSLTGASGRLRSASKASSTGVPAAVAESSEIAGFTSDTENGQEFRFLPRHGPGKASTRSVASKMSLAQIAEMEHPTALTQEVLDEADRVATIEATHNDQENIRASAYQFIEGEFMRPALGDGFHDDAAPRLQIHQPAEYQPYRPHHGDERPTTSGSGTTFDQAQTAFGDFDGVHCDPDVNDFPTPQEPDHHTPHLRPQGLAPRPTSYLDPATGQQMLFYPAPVPAMLNLPPKLSKKPKPSPREIRRSQIMSGMPQPARNTRASWLPDPMEGLHGVGDDSPLMGSLLGGDTGSRASVREATSSGMDSEARAQLDASYARHSSEGNANQPPSADGQREIRLPQRLTDNSKSRSMGLDSAPPQLRASAFFELPSTAAPKIEVTDGSAMATLDSILEASAAAPVSAFTDHAFAGKLGAEVYGKKKKVKKGAAAAAAVPEEKPKPRKLVKRNSSANLLDPAAEKKRASRFTLFGSKRDGDDSDDDEGGKDRRYSADGGVGSRNGRATDSPDAPGTDDETEEESEDEEVYQGAPTTLLAELQLRKQQAKMRTRPQVRPDAMQSTLLELDAVAEVERKARTGKRITLAWEDPNAKRDQESDDDEEVPLGMLYAAKANGNRSNTMDISALMSEVNRPLGLMERRELEDNEPLSRRRDRLQGRETAAQPLSLSVMQQRMSHLPTGGLGMRSQSRLALPLQASAGGSRPGSAAGPVTGPDDSDSEPERAGESLAARKARLAAENPLPRARPVSGAFSSELLSQFEPEPEPEPKPESKRPAHSRNVSALSAFSAASGPNTAAAEVPEEEETLGQRRRRIQREREAREREMAASALMGNNPNRISRAPTTFSLADVLTAHAGGQQRAMSMGVGARPPMNVDPREVERVRREAEAARVQREQEAKMAMLRAQMPVSLTSPLVGARTGGYMGGRFNDGLGGVPGVPGMMQQQRANTLLGAPGGGMMPYGGGYAAGSTPNLAVGGVNRGVLPHPGAGYAAPYGVVAGGNQDNMVERWRQGVLP